MCLLRECTSCNSVPSQYFSNPAPGDLQLQGPPVVSEGRRLKRKAEGCTAKLLLLQALESGAWDAQAQKMFRSHRNLVEDFFSDAHGHVHIEDFCSFVEEDRSFEPFAGVTRSFFASGPQFGPLEESGARRTHAQHTWPRREQARTYRPY